MQTLEVESLKKENGLRYKQQDFIRKTIKTSDLGNSSLQVKESVQKKQAGKQLRFQRETIKKEN